MFNYRNTVLLTALGCCMGLMGHSIEAPDSLVFTEVCVANIDQTLDYSNNYGSWVELHNPTDRAVDLDRWYISDDATNLAKHKLEGYGMLEPGGYKCIFFDHHASEGEYGVYAYRQVRFKLNRNGGALYLSANGTTAGPSVVYPPSIARCSYALADSIGNAWAYCGLPTPKAANVGYYADECIGVPVVDCDSRLFTDSFTVQATIPAGATLRYTTDGSTPTLTHGTTSSNGRFNITETTVLRLRLFADSLGLLPSGVVTRTYILKDRDYNLPIVAIATAPRNLYDDQIGCYVKGKNGIPGRGSKENSNLNMDWERPVNFEYLTADGQMVINQETSFEVAGGYSRHFAPASFKVQAKKLYDGKGSFPCPVFVGKPYCRYKQLLIRNGGNNNRTNGGPRIKDAITQQVLTSSGYYVDAQDYQPAHVFINGQYVAMMNVREPNNRFHGFANYGYDNDEVDAFEYSCGYRQKGGSRDAFDRLIALSAEADTDEGYAEVCKLLDIEEFVRYMAATCYTGSYDWLLTDNNVKGYRSWDDGKFHFVFFDQDLTWEHTDNVEAIEGVMTNEVLVLYNNLKRNPTFCQQFVTAYHILHGSIYTPARCAYIADSICALVKKALTFDNRSTLNTYNKMRQEMWGATARLARVQALERAYQLAERLNVVVNTNHDMGRILLNGQQLPFNSFSGVLTGSETLVAETAKGYEFMGWKNKEGEWISHVRECPVTKGGTYTAVFDTTFDEALSPICINEVSAANDIFVNDYGKHADWLELYNRGKEPIDAAMLYFSDEAENPLKCQLDAAPAVCTIIQPNGHLVVWCDGKPSVTQPHLPFKLKNNAGSGILSLLSADGRWQDTIRYDAHGAKETVGRYPDGGHAVHVFYHPTIGSHNMATIYDAVTRPVPDDIAGHAADPCPGHADIFDLQGRRLNAVPAKGLYVKDGKKYVK